MSISDTDRKRLRDGSAGECSFRGCLVRKNLEEAHIVAAQPEGPRGDASMTVAERDAYANRILLCPNHHALIDDTPAEWTVEKLNELKAAHERDVSQRLAQTPEERNIVLGSPVESPDEYADRTHLVPDPQYASSGTMRPPLIRTGKEQLVYRLFRVQVTSEGRDATNVRVQLANSAPPLAGGLPNPILHLAGDNPADHVSFEESRGFNLVAGVARYVDVIAVTKNSPYRCFIFSIASDDALEEHNEMDGRYTLRLAVTSGSEHDYEVDVDLRRGTLSMVRANSVDAV